MSHKTLVLILLAVASVTTFNATMLTTQLVSEIVAAPQTK